MNTMIERANNSKFQLPIYLFPLIAFGINIIGDTLGGTLGMKLCSQFHLTGAASNRMLLLSVAVNALLVMFWVRFIECRSIQDLGFCKHAAIRDSLTGAGAGLISFSVIIGLCSAVHVAVFRSADISLANILSVLLMIPFWIIQAGAEEILTRGWVLPVVSEKTNKLTGIVISSTLFVVLHLDNAGFNMLAMINIFLVGVLLALYTLKSDTLWGAILFHAFWNFTQGSFYGLSVSGSASASSSLMSFTSQGSVMLSGGKFGIEASIITTVVLGLLLGILILTSSPQMLRSLFHASEGNLKTTRN